MKPSIALLTLLFFLASVEPAIGRTVLISDIDDTVKVSYVFGTGRGIQYFRNAKARFTGMSELYNLLEGDQSGLRVYYVSAAPEYLMKNTHDRFLRNGGFPRGVYVGRTESSTETHKLLSIRKILREELPDRVVMIGDDGQSDAVIYRTISREREFSRIVFDQFIRVVSSRSGPSGSQTGFLTSYDLALEMRARGLIQERSLRYMHRFILPAILREAPGGDIEDQTENIAFPKFLKCGSFSWKWNVPVLNERVKAVCRN